MLRVKKRHLTLGVTTLAIAGCGAAMPATVPAAPKKPGNARVAGVGKHLLKLRWKDRANNERRYQTRFREVGTSGWIKKRLPANSTKHVRKGLENGKVYQAQVRACGGGCSRWAKARNQATLISGFAGTHPDIQCDPFPAYTGPANGPSAADMSAWNQDVSGSPLDPNSANYITKIQTLGGENLHPDFGSRRVWGIPWIVVPHNQPNVPINFTDYGDESDPGPYPIPPNAFTEGGRGSDGDRHVIVVKRPSAPGGACTLYETFYSFWKGGVKNKWDASSGAVFNMDSKALHPDTWTSADAAGLPIFPGLVRYEEVFEDGVINHALRVTFEQTRDSYINPAVHKASDRCNANLPPMGLRLRMKAGYDISGLTGPAKVIATAMKRYGLIVTDNGGNWFFTGASDRRWNDDQLGQLKDVPGTAFEVVQSAAPQTTDC